MSTFYSEKSERSKPLLGVSKKSVDVMHRFLGWSWGQAGEGLEKTPEDSGGGEEGEKPDREEIPDASKVDSVGSMSESAAQSVVAFMELSSPG